MELCNSIIGETADAAEDKWVVLREGGAGGASCLRFSASLGNFHSPKTCGFTFFADDAPLAITLACDSLVSPPTEIQ